MANWTNCSPTVTSCTFTGNAAGVNGTGGGMRNADNSHPTVTDCTFTANTSVNNGGGMYNSESSPTVMGCDFTMNSGAAGAGMRNITNSSPTIVDCSFTDNVAAAAGGGVASWDYSSPSVINCEFSGNSSVNNGGAIMSYNNSHTMAVNCLFTDNSSGNRGGAVRDALECRSTFTNCTFSGNSATQAGGAVSAGSDVSGTIGHTTVYNCILWNDTAPLGPEIALIGNFPADMTVAYSDVQGGEPGAFVQFGSTLNWGAGNIDADPMFVDAGNGDFRLLSGSPANDAAHNWAIVALASTDLDGNPRFADDPATPDTGCGIPVIVDMGAYEFQGDPFPVKFADVDGNGVVGVTDFLALLAAWGPCPDDCCLADFDLDGMVGVTDFLILLANWG
jgi:predicted outer membrane repeat protein